jgi:hypothetical protein
MTGGRRARRALAAGGALAAAGACVAIETAPGGVQSARIGPTPPSIVAGDVLRDSTGAATAVTAVAFDENGNPVETARVRYTYVPTADTTNTGIPDTALVVDSVTGVVRATLPLERRQGRVAAVVGERLQLIQTIEIVTRPDSMVPEAFTPPVLRYDCSDPGSFPLPVPDTGSTRFEYNTVRLPAVTVRGDSLGRLVSVRSRLVRWDVDSGPFAAGRIPRVALVAGGRDSVPAVAVVAGAADILRPLDTTSTAGVSAVRLRIRPAALGNATVPAREFTVRVRARGQPGPRALANETLYFRVRLERTTTPIRGATTSCP